MGGRSVAENLSQVRKKIEAALKKSGRAPGSVTVVAVSKTKPVALIEEAVRAGALDFGENYVQELTAKMSEYPNASVRWHFIGSLQRNKCKQIVGRAHLIHSVDRLEVAQEIAKHAAGAGRIQNVLLQIKIGSEDTKSGVPLERAGLVMAELRRLPGLNLRGLMTFPPMYENPEDARRDFRALAEFQREMKMKFQLQGFDDLSMGSSHDYEVAIEEGSTIVRIGTEIFGERAKEQP